MNRKLLAILGFGTVACILGMLRPDSDPSENKDSKKMTVAKALEIQALNRSNTDEIRAPRSVHQIPNLIQSLNIDASKLGPKEIELLGQLPPICTSELPGMPYEQENQPDPGLAAQSGSNIQQDTYIDGGYPLGGSHQSAHSLSHSQKTQPNPYRSAPITINPLPLIEQQESSGQGSGLAQLPIQDPHLQLANHTGMDEPLNVAQAVLDSSTSPDTQPPKAHVAKATFNPHSKVTKKPKAPKDGSDPHLEIYSRDAYPSAQECATCHEQLYEEWASSSHAYASISPMFHKFEDTINNLSQGTVGYFCLRCHAPVATTMGLRRDQAIWDGPKVFREGVTCVACHRVKTPYGKVNGQRRIEPGPITDPVYGGSDGQGVATATKYSEYFKTKTREESKTPGQLIHRRSVQFEEITKSTFCVSCHQVAVQPGIKLEVVWDQYRDSPAYRQGITCQECHMGKEPGVAEGYTFGPAAVIDDKVVNPERKHSNHIFYGPGYSIAHPGIFPHTKEADRWTVNEWLEFDWRSGWGTEEFEDAVDDGKIVVYFPEVWKESDDRYDARDIVTDNLKKLEYKRDLRRQLLENGSKLDGPFFAGDPQVDQPLAFHFCVTNTNSGHNMPSGSLGAQPQLWLNAVLIGPNGDRLWESGYLDSNGDLCDLHSLDVANRSVPLDKQLFNLQTKFLTTNVKGTDREMYLPINVDVDQLPFLRPAAQPVSVINHPPGIRMEGHSIPPLGSRKAKYVVPRGMMQQPGIYRISVRMRSRAEPIYFMRFCNSTPEMERMMNEWICDFHVHSVTFEVR